MHTYSEGEIARYVNDYADHHDVEPDAVIIDRRFADGGKDGLAVIGFRLSLDVDGRSRGCDERFGAW